MRKLKIGVHVSKSICLFAFVERRAIKCIVLFMLLFYSVGVSLLVLASDLVF